MKDYLHHPKDIIVFDQIRSWITQDQLSERQREQLGDYLTIKKEMKSKWSKNDYKQFLRAKRLLAQDSQTITEIKVRKKAIV